MIQNIKKSIVLFLFIQLLCCCSDDNEHIEGEVYANKYEFVGSSYSHQWTLQGTSSDFKVVITFNTDSTFTFTPIKVETGEIRAEPGKGKYKVGDDGHIYFINFKGYNTKIRGYEFTLYEAVFEDFNVSLLKVKRRIDFSKNDYRVDWSSFHKE